MATATQTLPSTPAGLTPDAFVQSLSDEQKEAVLGSLLREAMRLYGAKSVIALDDGLGYFVPPAAAAAHFKIVPPKLTPEQDAAIRRAIATPDDTFDMDECLEELSREDQG